MRLALKSLLVPLLALVPFVHTAAQGLDASGGFNPVPYLAADVDSARQAYEDAQAKRDLALDKKRATGNAYNHALDRAEVKDDAQTRAAVEKTKADYDTASAEYSKARKQRDDASETFFKVRTAAAKAAQANAPQETP